MIHLYNIMTTTPDDSAPEQDPGGGGGGTSCLYFFSSCSYLGKDTFITDETLLIAASKGFMTNSNKSSVVKGVLPHGRTYSLVPALH